MANPPFSTVTTEDQLNQDLAAIAGGTSSYTISFGAGFTLNTDLLAVNLGPGGSLTLLGNGQTIDGAGAYRGLFDYAGALTIDDLTIANAVARGGSGGTAPTNGNGAGGGGAGLGGGLFVASAGNATLNNVTFVNDQAIGGNGGNNTGSSTTAAGGGGGMGGNGGNARQVSDGSGGFDPEDGSGGGIGLSATGGSLSPGGPGIIPTDPATRIGGGGGTGSGQNYFSGPGGIQPGSFGGGGSGNQNGGFGGGGGGNSNGGFGGGGGGDSTGGFGAGNGGVSKDFVPGGGGGGLGAGADVFVQAGGQLTIGAASLGVGTVAGGSRGGTAGAGATQATAGSAFGNGIFVQGNQSVTFAPSLHVTTTVSSVIADQNGSIPSTGGGAGSVVMAGVGTLDLAIAEPYTGGTTIKSGTLELGAAGAAGSGNIAFGGPATLRIDTAAMPINVITGFGTADNIDLAGLPYAAGATASITANVLSVTSGGTTVKLNVTAPNATLATQSDFGSGTLVYLPTPVVTTEAQLNTLLASLAGSTTANAINIGASFTLNTDLNMINLGTGGSLVINGGGFAIDGASAWRGFTVYNGTVAINSLGLNNMLAKGGTGGDAPNPGGGGAGLGGALLIASGGNVTLDSVTFSGDAAQGGKGGSYVDNGYAGGGGGGLGGPGGSGPNNKSDGGGGGFGPFAAGGMNGVNSGVGGAGAAVGAASGGNGGQGTAGGINGGGGGDAGSGDAGGGGIGGQTGNSAGNYGGNGGWGGGGGGGGSGPSGVGFGTNGGGSGGFGGGAGGFSNSSHAGGFGGGGGGGGGTPGMSGWGGGLGGGSNYGGGGGGAGLGGDILVQQGGFLTIQSGSVAAGTVNAGSGGTGRSSNPGSAGGAFGNGIFLQGNQTMTLAPGLGLTLTIAGVIADQNGSIPSSGGQAGLVVAGAGLVNLTAANTWTGGTTLTSGTLELAKTTSEGSGPIVFSAPSAAQTLKLDYVAGANATIAQVIQGFSGGANTLIYLPNVDKAGIAFGSYSGTDLKFTAGGMGYEFTSLSTANGYTINASSIAADASGTGVDIFAAVLCFAEGTRLRTPSGEVAVEALAEGDLVTTPEGSRPVTWIGRRHIDIAAHPEPETVQPIRIRRGAVAPGVPARDVLVSPDHAIHFDGTLIPARLLVNGASITHESGRAAVTYFHVELAEHAILFAEGLEAESYLDTGNRAMFENAAVGLLAHPDLSIATRMRHGAATTCLPLVVDEARVRPVWERLAKRAGQDKPMQVVARDPTIRLLAGEREIRPIPSKPGTLVFALPPGQRAARLVSHTARACDARPWLDDRRRLGIAVGRMLVRNGAEVTEIAADDPGLADGWWDAESDGRRSWRWTAGDARIALPSGASMLEIQVIGTMA